MDATFLSVMTFLAVVTAVAGIYSILTDLFLRDRSNVTRRIDLEFVKHRRDEAQKCRSSRTPVKFGVELQVHDDDRSVRRRFQAMVEQSGLNLTAGRLLAQSAAAGFLTWEHCWVALPEAARRGLSPLRSEPHYRSTLSRESGERPVGEAPGTTPGRLRADVAGRPRGQTISQALRAVSDEFSPPLAAEFASCYEQQNLGLSLESALRDLAQAHWTAGDQDFRPRASGAAADRRQPR